MATAVFVEEDVGAVEFVCVEGTTYVARHAGSWSCGSTPEECERRFKGALSGLREEGSIYRLPEGCTHFTLVDGGLRWRGVAPGVKGKRLAFNGKGWE